MAYRIRAFRRIVRRHFRLHGRDLPWRRTTDPYRILVSEIMLQQTQVPRVIPKYFTFLRRFPNFRSLAAAKPREVLAVWQGLGYNRRALALRTLAKIVVEQYGGTLPQNQKTLMRLPGIGNATAGALCVFAFNQPAAFVETNIRRAFIHFFFSRSRRVPDEKILALVRRSLPKTRIREWYWALMDYGAVLAMRLPKSSNPNRKSMHYRRQSPFEGSQRQLRGKIIRVLLGRTACTAAEIARSLEAPLSRVSRALKELEKDGLVQRKRRRFMI